MKKFGFIILGFFTGVIIFLIRSNLGIDLNPASGSKTPEHFSWGALILWGAVAAAIAAFYAFFPHHGDKDK